MEENNRERQVESLDVSSKKYVLKMYETLHRQQKNQTTNVDLSRIFIYLFFCDGDLF